MPYRSTPCNTVCCRPRAHNHKDLSHPESGHPLHIPLQCSRLCLSASGFSRLSPSLCQKPPARSQICRYHLFSVRFLLIRSHRCPSPLRPPAPQAEPLPPDSTDIRYLGRAHKDFPCCPATISSLCSAGFPACSASGFPLSFHPIKAAHLPLLSLPAEFLSPDNTAAPKYNLSRPQIQAHCILVANHMFLFSRSRISRKL